MKDDSEIIVYRKDLLSRGICYKGSRKFLKRHGWSWKDFRINGISSKLLESTGDAMVIAVVEDIRGK